MASNFSLSTKSYQGRYLRLDCTQTKDIANNRSKIDWILTSTGGSATFYSTGATTVVINGETVYKKSRVEWTQKVFPAAKGSVSGTIYVSHNTKGEATITASIKTAIYVGEASASTVSDSWTLDTLPRAAKLLTAPAALNDGTPSASITFENIAGEAVSELWLCIGDRNWGVITNYKQIKDLASGAFSYTISEDEHKLLQRRITKGNTLDVRYYLRSTIAGEYQFDTLDGTYTILAPEPTLAPTIANNHEKSYELTGSYDVIISEFNNIVYNSNAQVFKEATIANHLVSCGTRSNDKIIGTLENVDSGIFNFSVTDSRGYTTTETIEKPFIEYIRPTISQEVEIRLEGETEAKITVTLSGNYFNDTFGAVDNTLILSVRHTDDNGDWLEWDSVTVPVAFEGNAYEITYSDDNYFFNHDKAYTFQSKITDATGIEETTGEYTVKLTPIFDWGENDFNFNVPISINARKFLTVPVPDLNEFGKYNMVDFLTYQKNPDAESEEDEYFDGIMELGFKDGDEGAELNIYGGDSLSLNAGNNGIRLNADYIFINNTLVADFVIEQGTEAMGSNGTWYWEKWKSGKAVCYGTRNFGNMAITTPWGSWYESSSFSQSFPSGLFIDTPTVSSINLVKASGAGFITQGFHSDLSANATGNFTICRPVSGNLSQVYLSFNAIGRWK